MFSRRILVVNFALVAFFAMPNAFSQKAGMLRTRSPQAGYEMEVEKAEEELNLRLMFLDGMIKRGEVCSQLTAYQAGILKAKAQVEAVGAAWKVYFEEVNKRQQILIETAKRSYGDYMKEREKMEADTRKLNDSLADLQRRAHDLPPDAPADRRKTLNALIESTRLQMAASEKLLEALASDYEARKNVAMMDTLIQTAYQLQSTSKDIYYRANKLLVEVRYQAPMDQCLGLPQGPR